MATAVGSDLSKDEAAIVRDAMRSYEAVLRRRMNAEVDERIRSVVQEKLTLCRLVQSKFVK